MKKDPDLSWGVFNAPYNIFYRKLSLSHYFITGASSGIGQALALALSSNGHSVTAVARRLERLQDLQINSPNINIFQGDVSNPSDMKTIVEDCSNLFGQIDCAILNAGKYVPLGGADINSREFYDHMMVNYMGVVHVLDCLIPAFKSTGSGHIAIMGSTAGYRGLPRSAAYGPTKAALANLAEALYLDLEPYGIKVQMISPGFVETEATAVNDFKMPQIISASKAAIKIIKGLNSNQFEICFPTGFVWVMKLFRLLPHSFYARIIKGITK